MRRLDEFICLLLQAPRYLRSQMMRLLDMRSRIWGAVEKCFRHTTRSGLGWLRDPLIKVFLSYVFLTSLFSVIYWQLYLLNNFNFSFNQGIKSGTHWEVISDAYALIGAIRLLDKHEPPYTVEELEFAYASELEARRILDGDNRSFHYPSLLRSYENKMQAERSRLQELETQVTEKFLYCDWILNSYVDVHNRSGIDGPQDSIHFSFKTDACVVTSFEVRDSLMLWLENLDSLMLQRQWGFVDFLYFSVVTMTTLGFGDIVPNSTLVRCCVLIQVLTGLFLLTIAVVLVSRGIGSHGTGIRAQEGTPADAGRPRR